MSFLLKVLLSGFHRCPSLFKNPNALLVLIVSLRASVKAVASDGENDSAVRFLSISPLP